MKSHSFSRIIALTVLASRFSVPVQAGDTLADLDNILRLREHRRNPDIIRACESFLESHQKSAVDATVRFYHAKALFDSKKYPASIAAVGELLAKHPATDLLEVSVMLRGEGYRMLRKYEESIPDFRRARELAHVNQAANAAHAHYHIIQALHFRKQADAARAELAALKKDYPRSAYLRSAAALLNPAPRAETGPKLGTVAPDIEFFELTGTAKGRLSDYQGKVIILDFWAGWCGPCIQPMTAIQTYPSKYPEWGEQVEILAVSMDDSIAKAAAAGKARGWNISHNVWGGEGRYQSPAAKTYDVHSIPRTFVIDRNGRIVQRGNPRAMDLPAIVNGLLPKKQPPPGPISGSPP